MLRIFKAYFSLTKPKIMLLILSAGLTALIIEGSLLSDPIRLNLFLIGLFLTGGSANALNQCFERNIDSVMTRTKDRRALPLGSIPYRKALIFSIIIGLVGVLLLGLNFNRVTAFLAVGTIIFYSLIYTLILKPRTSQNIVIGGLAGAMAPLGAWTAATGTTALTPWLLFLLVFFWTPPHFWSLAIYFKDDYQKAKLPMMPNIKGTKYTLNMIFLYTVVTVAISMLLLYENFGWIYLTVSIILGTIFLKKTNALRRQKDSRLIWDIFKFSIYYLFAIFLALIVDKFV